MESTFSENGTFNTNFINPIEQEFKNLESTFNTNLINPIEQEFKNLESTFQNASHYPIFDNGTKAEYCQNNECTYATVAFAFIGWPVLIAVSFCVITCLGFTFGGVVGGSLAASCQSACYGGATTGCFSLLQSAGAGGLPGIIFGICVLGLFWTLPSIGTWYLCLYTCEKLNEGLQ